MAWMSLSFHSLMLTGNEHLEELLHWLKEKSLAAEGYGARVGDQEPTMRLTGLRKTFAQGNLPFKISSKNHEATH